MRQTISSRSTQPANVVLRTLSGPRPEFNAAPAADRANVLAAVRDGDVNDRALDVIVDRMLKELTW